MVGWRFSQTRMNAAMHGQRMAIAIASKPVSNATALMIRASSMRSGFHCCRRESQR